MDSTYGFKTITLENWDQPDKVSVKMAPLSRSAFAEESKGNPFLEYILRPHLKEDVPYEIRRLFEVARGAMVYSYFFYPLFTIALEQLFRVGEAAIKAKVALCNTGKSSSHLVGQIEILQEAGVLDEPTAFRWQQLRVEARSILPFNRALFFSVWDAVSRVNLLFILWENATEETLVATNWGTISGSPTVLGVKTPEITTNFQELQAWESK